MYDPEKVERIIRKIRSRTLQRLLKIYDRLQTIHALLPEEFGGWGVEYDDDRPTTKSLKKLMEKLGWKGVSDRTVRDYAYAIEALSLINSKM